MEFGGFPEALAAAYSRQAAELRELRAENAALRAALAEPAAGTAEPCHAPEVLDRGGCGDHVQREGHADLPAALAVASPPQPPDVSPALWQTAAPPHGGPDPKLSSLDCSTAAASVFVDGTRRLVAVDESSLSVEFFIHEHILFKMPYFEARAARWAVGDAGELHLPKHCPHSALNSLVQRLYAVDVQWSVPDWLRVLDPDLPAAFGTLLLAKMLLASDLVPEVLMVVRQMASDADSVAWLQRALEGLDVPELEGFGRASDPAPWDSATLRQAALSAMKGPAEGRRLFSASVAGRESVGLAVGGTAALISVLQDCGSYVSHSCTHRRPRARAARSEAAAGAAGRYRAWVCDFFQPLRVPAEGFQWLWELVEGRLVHEPELYAQALGAFQALQWLEHDASANRRGEASATGTKRLLYVPESTTKHAIRRTFASFLRLGLKLLNRGQIGADTFVAAFSCGVLSPAQAPGASAGRRRNLLQFKAREDRVPGSMYSTDLVATVLSSVSAGVSASIVSSIPSFKECQGAFTPDAVRSLADEQQAACVRACSLQWLTGGLCTVLRGEARSVACSRLAPNVGTLSSDQRAFMWGIVSEAAADVDAAS